MTENSQAAWQDVTAQKRRGLKNPFTAKKLSRGQMEDCEPQGLLKDSPLCDDATPIPPDLCRRLDEPTPTDGHRIPSGRESHSPGTTRWQTQALHRRPANPAGSQSQARRSGAAWGNWPPSSLQIPSPLV